MEARTFSTSWGFFLPWSEMNSDYAERGKALRITQKAAPFTSLEEKSLLRAPRGGFFLPQKFGVRVTPPQFQCGHTGQQSELDVPLLEFEATMATPPCANYTASVVLPHGYSTHTA